MHGLASVSMKTIDIRAGVAQWDGVGVVTVQEVGGQVKEGGQLGGGDQEHQG